MSLWKEDNAKYRAIHRWIESQLGKPRLCWCCRTITAVNYHWANISQKYKKDINDWARLCPNCHKQFDLGFIPITELKRFIKESVLFEQITNLEIILWLYDQFPLPEKLIFQEALLWQFMGLSLLLRSYY